MEKFLCFYLMSSKSFTRFKKERDLALLEEEFTFFQNCLFLGMFVFCKLLTEGDVFHQ